MRCCNIPIECFLPYAAQAKLPMSFTPSPELAMEGQCVKASVSTSATQQQARAARDGLSDDEQKIHGLLVRGKSCNKLMVLMFSCDGGTSIFVGTRAELDVGLCFYLAQCEGRFFKNVMVGLLRKETLTFRGRSWSLEEG